MKYTVTKIGDKRWKRKFCTTPKFLGHPGIGRQKVWMEWVWVQEEYKMDRTSWDGIGWVEVWVQTEEPILT